MEIKIAHVGRIIDGDDIGLYVKVLDDSKTTGGFLVFTSTDQRMSNVYDNWVADRETLSRYFEESGWVIEWMNK